MPDWTKVDWEELNKEPQHEQIRGVEFNVFFSPYDMPEAVCGEYDPKRDRFLIRFKYLGGQEKLRREELDEYVTLGFGRASRRLLEIAIDAKALGATGIGLAWGAVANDVDAALKKIAHGDRAKNIEAASGAIRQNRIANELEKVMSSGA